MKLIHRIGFYLGGFSIGLVILAFFLNGKDVSCDYGPEARVIKNINSKRFVYSKIVQQDILNKKIDSTTLHTILKKGDVNFSNSDTRHEPCGLYAIEKDIENQNVSITVENCDSIVTIQKITWK